MDIRWIDPTLPYPTEFKRAIQLFKKRNVEFVKNRYGPRQQKVVQGQPTIAIREIPVILLETSLDRVASI